MFDMTASSAVPKERSFSRRQKRTTIRMLFKLVGPVILVKIYELVMHIYVRLLSLVLIITFKMTMSSYTNIFSTRIYN